MRRLLVLLLVVGLAACGGGGVRERVFPPTLSVQELAVQPDGAWALKLRLENFSNVGMRVDAVNGTLTLGGADAAIALQPGAIVPAESAEVFDLRITPPAAASDAVRAAQEKNIGIRYTLTGTITSSEPERRRDEFTQENNHLSPVPGLSGVLR